jgi:hypothetical protein
VNWRQFPGLETLQDFRDFRLALASQFHEGTSRGRDLKLGNLSTFAREIDNTMDFFSSQSNLVLPLKRAWLCGLSESPS